MGTNGKILTEAIVNDLRPSVSAGNKVSRIALGFVPFTPVAFTGEDAWLAYARMAAYGTLAYMTFNKARPISYSFMIAAGVSVATSMSAGAWKK